MMFVSLLLAFFSSFNSYSHEPTREELRWSLSQDLWHKKDMYIMKGRYFRVNFEKAIKDEDKIFKVYTDSKFTTHPEFIISLGGVEKKGGIHCDGDIPKKLTSSNEVVKCVLARCDSIKSNKLIEFNEYNHLDWGLLHNGKKCPLPVHYVIASHSYHSPDDLVIKYRSERPGTQMNFKYDSITEDKRALIIKSGNKNYYIDIQMCSRNKDMCAEVNYAQSMYEKDLAKLEEYKSKRNMDILNILIRDLLPCVERKDRKCIQNYFVNEKDEEQLELGKSFKYPDEIIVADEMINELRACLNYNQLLPHLLGSRGINKVCIFQDTADSSIGNISAKNMVGVRLMGIAYPEAVRHMPLDNEVIIKP